MSEMKTVYILLTRSTTCFSRLIHLATDEDYTHASIGLDGPFGRFYSFARKHEHFALPAGLVEEQVHTGLLRRMQDAPCCLYALSVTPEVYERLRGRLSLMVAQRERYHYNLLGTILCLFNRPLARRYHYFCSQFVAELLQGSGALSLSKSPALFHPADFCRVAGLQTLHRGAIGALPLSVPA